MLRLFSRCSEWGYSLVAVWGFSLWCLLSLWSTGSRARGLDSCSSWALDYKLNSCGARCSAACGIFLDQGSNPCLLHWQADSLPLSHQGSPPWSFQPTVYTTALPRMPFPSGLLLFAFENTSYVISYRKLHGTFPGLRGASIFLGFQGTPCLHEAQHSSLRDVTEVFLVCSFSDLEYLQDRDYISLLFPVPGTALGNLRHSQFERMHGTPFVCF